MLKARLLVILLGVGALFGVLAMVRMNIIGSEYAPKEDENQLSVNLSMPPGVTLDATDRVAQQVEAVLSDKTRFPEVKTLFTSVGGGGFGGEGARRTSPSSWRTRSTAPAPCGTSRARSGAWTRTSRTSP